MMVDINLIYLLRMIFNNKYAGRDHIKMQQREQRKLHSADIGYHGKPIDNLSREELLGAFVELTQLVYDCASTNNKCKALVNIAESK